ncbi:DUF4288 domain-containing protein [Kineosporia babensis]|uniref:DUF4288 domain-containing protein n=1 Tax=Kineosporia babensis TaxID=499548 RepID=A0A9X1NLS3_9ACTN|nr:DUF4288 domain-containing protein [Kineosporia babensis]MCD5315904.1 DUF4288 domain-containing protein [Kineosporia babensis]
MTDDAPRERAWYAVRCVFQSGWPPASEASCDARAYEERITLWRALSADDAIERAQAEAREYAATITEHPDTYLGLAQSYRLFDEPADGAEIFSLVRLSDLAAEQYLDRHFDTGQECQKAVAEDDGGGFGADLA